MSSTSTEWPESLTDPQIAELKASAISPQVACRMGLYSVDDARAAAKLFGRTAKAWEGHLPVLVLPYRLPFQRDPVLVRGKPARPFETPKADGTVSLAKYVQAKDTGVHVMLGPSLFEGGALRDVKTPLLLTEGEKKLAAAESAGFSCVALPGVSQWHLKGEKILHPYFAHVALAGRVVFLCFDADSLANKDVRREELAFGRALRAAGAIVFIVRFPPDAPKLDDYLATHELSEFHALLDDARINGQLPPDTAASVQSEDWQGVFSKLRLDNDTGLPIKDGDNIARVLMLHPGWKGVLAFDSRHERQMFQQAPPFADEFAVIKAPVPRPLIDTDITRVAFWLAGQSCLGWTIAPQQSALEHAIATVCERNRFDGIGDYLAKLAWDNEPRLDTMGTVYFGVKNTAYTRAVFSKWMLSAVARARTPGCQVDHVLVLEGPQGKGKSTALRILAGDDYFSDTLPELGKDAHEHCIGPWIVELAELDHMRRSEVTAIKAFISTRAPSFRGAYARRTAKHPRRCVFAASTNEAGYLTDSTGNRRFWPVECETLDLDALARDRDQLWAEAVHRIRAGETWHITDPGVREEAEEEQAARREVDPWHPLIMKFVTGRKHVTVGDVLDFLGHGPEEPRGFGSYQREPRKAANYDQRSANRISAVLRELGWVRRMVRTEGGRVWRYDAPDTSRGRTGDRVEPCQVIGIKGLSPVSPVSPLDPVNNVRARDACTPPPAHAPTPEIRPEHSESVSSTQSSSIKSGDTGDSGDNTVKSEGYPGTTLSPVDGEVVTGEKPKRRRL